MHLFFPIRTGRQTQTREIACRTLRFIKIRENNKRSVGFFFDNAYQVFPIVENVQLPIYHVTLAEMTEEFKSKLKRTYEKNKQRKRILNFVRPQNDENFPIPKKPRFPVPKWFHLLHERIRWPKTFLHSKNINFFGSRS